MKTRHGTELPDSLKQIFLNKEVEYTLNQSYKEPGMDNVQSLRWFIDNVGIHSDNIAEDLGTQLVVSHPEFDYKLVIDSYGGGDFHSHRFAVSLFEGTKNQS